MQDDKEMQTALNHTAPPKFSDLEKAIIEHETRERNEAKVELKARLAEFRIAQSKEKEDWVFAALQEAAPMWAVRWAMEKGRGWILRCYNVTLDHIGLSRHLEVFEVRKKGKLIAFKLFRWDTGEHIEGVPRHGKI